MKDTVQNKKLLSLVIYEILRRETNELHPMTTETLLCAVKARGFGCDRKTLYNNINDMNAVGFEIMKNKSRSNSYYVCDRTFDDSELKMLIDAMQAAAFLTPDKTEKLCDKIASLAGRSGAESIKRNAVTFNITKNSNESVVYSVSSVSDAIERRKKITFKYFDYDIDHSRVFRKEGSLYVVNPLTTVYSDDKYYLVGYQDDHIGTTHYRIDRMTEVNISDENITVRPEMNEFDAGKYKKQLFGMFSGARVSTSFIADDSNFIINSIFDKFGPDTVISRTDEGHIAFNADVQLSNPFFAWVCTFGGKIKINGPESVKTEYKNFLASNAID